MTNDSIEQQLRQLGEEWPADDSFVERVISRIDSNPPRQSVSTSAGKLLMRTSYLTIGAIIACLGLWWVLGWQSTGSVLYAQVTDALQQVQTIHEVANAHTDDGKTHQFAETWFARGRGFCLISDDQVRIDNGTWFWDHKKGSDTASRTKSLGTDELLDQALNLREQLERDCERYPEGDRSIDGVPHKCYRLTFHGAVKPVDPSVMDLDKQRTLIFISPKSLPTRAEMLEKIDGDWKTRFVRTWEYDVPVEQSVFEPQFAEGVRVIDIDKAFEQLTAVENAVHTEEREGLIYTIHQAKRFENGGVMLVSSVRGTAETLKKYPLTRRMLQPGRYFIDGPATNYEASPQGSESFRLSLAKANHQGIDIEWWMMVPRGRLPNWFEDKDGKVKLEVGITPQDEYAKANHADERGVIHHITWELPLDIPKPDQLPSLNDIAASVHSDLSMLKALIFPGELNMGVKNIDGTPTSQFGSPDDVSPEEFAKAAREHWQWWERGDVDFQIKSGGASYGNEIGGGLKPAVMVDYISVVDDTTLARAAERSNLVVLSARGTTITDAGLKHLKSLTRLRKLDVAKTSVTDDGLLHLKSMTSLETLNLTETRVTQAGIELLRKSLPDIVIVTNDDDASTQPSENVTKSGNAPHPLPATVNGTVIDLEDRPVANARVTVLIRTFSKNMHEELKGPLVWTAMTDEEGRYSFAPTGTVHPNNEVRIKVVAEGFADLSDRDYEKKILDGVMPAVRMFPGRRITGRLVAEDGVGVTEAIVRFQSNNANLTMLWDSGPFPVDADGRFSLSIPMDGTAAGAIYPTGFAPRFVDVTKEADQGEVVLEKGVTQRGRVVDKNGQGVANIIVGIRKTEYRIMHAFMAVIGTAVRSDETGYFQLPALKGSYTLSVGPSIPDYSGQMMLDGETPPSIKQVTIEFDGSRPDEVILLQEQTP
jgi:hypothetical protein